MSEPRPKGMASLSAWQHEEKSVHILLGATRRRVAETQHYRQLSAALHKFKVRPGQGTLLSRPARGHALRFLGRFLPKLGGLFGRQFFCALADAMQAQIYQATAILT